MKTYFALLLVAASVFAPTSRAATINWTGTIIPDPQVNIDSNGGALNSGFTFALGIFDPLFTPDENNLAMWYDNFTVFDVAAYNDDNGFFTSSAVLELDGSRLGTNADSPLTSPPQSAATGGSLVDYDEVFAGKQAYLWVYNTTGTGASWEWALVRSTSWTFPEFNDEVCCDTNVVNWSVADITGGNAVLKYGGANNVRGPGTYNSPPTTFQIQTAVPEPTGAMLTALGGALALMRRRRQG